MNVANEILPTALNKATSTEKRAFFEALIALAHADGDCDKDELKFIEDTASEYGINPEKLEKLDIDKVLKNVTKIKKRPLALELIREMCILSHIDNTLSDNETLLIGKVGLAMGIELEKIEQISNWIIDHIIWIEQAKLIFEEKN